MTNNCLLQSMHYKKFVKLLVPFRAMIKLYLSTFFYFPPCLALMTLTNSFFLLTPELLPGRSYSFYFTPWKQTARGHTYPSNFPKNNRTTEELILRVIDFYSCCAKQPCGRLCQQDDSVITPISNTCTGCITGPKI